MPEPVAELTLALLGDPASFERMMAAAEARLDRFLGAVDAKGQQIQASVDRMLGNVSASAGKLDAALQPVVTALGDVGSAASVAGAEVRAASGELRAVSGDANAAAKSLTGVGEAGRSAGAGVAAGMGQTVGGTAKAQAALSGFVGTVNRLRAAADRPIVQRVTVQRTGGAGAGRAGGDRGAATAGYGLVMAGGAILGAEGDLVKQGEAVEDELRRLYATAGETEDFETLRREVLAIGDQFGLLPVQVAKALYPITSLGFKGADGLKVLTASANMAKGSQADLLVVSELISKTLNAYGLNADHAARLSDIFTRAIKDGVVPGKEFVDAYAGVMTISKSAGLSVEDTAAALATLTHNAKSAAIGGTQFRAFVSGIIAPTKAMRDAAHAAGLEWLATRHGADELKRVGLSGVLDEITKATNGNVTALTELFPDLRKVQAGLALLNNGGVVFTRTLKDVQNSQGATADASREMDKSLAQSGRNLDAAFQSAGSNLEDSLKPALTWLYSTLTKIINTFNRLSPASQAVVGDVAGVTGGVLLLVGAVTLAVRWVQSVGDVFGKFGVKGVAANRAVAASAGQAAAANGALEASADRAAAAEARIGAAGEASAAQLEAAATGMLTANEEVATGAGTASAAEAGVGTAATEAAAEGATAFAAGMPWAAAITAAILLVGGIALAWKRAADAQDDYAKKKLDAQAALNTPDVRTNVGNAIDQTRQEAARQQAIVDALKADPTATVRRRDPAGGVMDDSVIAWGAKGGQGFKGTRDQAKAQNARDLAQFEANVAALKGSTKALQDDNAATTDLSMKKRNYERLVVNATQSQAKVRATLDQLDRAIAADTKGHINNTRQQVALSKLERDRAAQQSSYDALERDKRSNQHMANYYGGLAGQELARHGGIGVGMGDGAAIAEIAWKKQIGLDRAAYSDKCQELARETVQAVTPAFNKYFAGTALQSLRNFQKAGLALPYTPGMEIPAGSLLYSQTMGKRGGKIDGHVAVEGTGGHYYDQHGQDTYALKNFQYYVPPPAGTVTNAPSPNPGGAEPDWAKHLGDKPARGPAAGSLKDIDLSRVPSVASLPADLAAAATNARTFEAKLQGLTEAFAEHGLKLKQTVPGYDELAAKTAYYGQRLALTNNAIQNTQAEMDRLTPKTERESAAVKSAAAAYNAYADRMKAIKAGGGKFTPGEVAEVGTLRAAYQQAQDAFRADDAALKENSRVHHAAVQAKIQDLDELGRIHDEQARKQEEARRKQDEYQRTLSGLQRETDRLTPRSDFDQRRQDANDAAGDAVTQASEKRDKGDYTDAQLSDVLGAILAREAAEVRRIDAEELADRRKTADEIEKIAVETGQESEAAYRQHLVAALQDAQATFGETSLQAAQLSLEIARIDWQGTEDAVEALRQKFDAGDLTLAQYIADLKQLQLLTNSAGGHKQIQHEIDSSTRQQTVQQQQAAKEAERQTEEGIQRITDKATGMVMQIAHHAKTIQQVFRDAFRDIEDTTIENFVRNAVKKLVTLAVSPHGAKGAAPSGQTEGDKMKAAAAAHTQATALFGGSVTLLGRGVTAFTQGVQTFGDQVDRFVGAAGSVGGSAAGGGAAGAGSGGDTGGGSNPGALPAVTGAVSGAQSGGLDGALMGAAQASGGAAGQIGASVLPDLQKGDDAQAAETGTVQAAGMGLLGNTAASIAPYVGAAIALISLFGPHKGYAPTRVQDQRYAGVLTSFSPTIDSGYSGSDGLRTLLGPVSRAQAGVGTQGQATTPQGHTLNITIAAGAFQGVADPQGHAAVMIQRISDGLSRMTALDNASRGEG